VHTCHHSYSGIKKKEIEEHDPGWPGQKGDPLSKIAITKRAEGMA
jgi:hypothetical protein